MDNQKIRIFLGYELSENDLEKKTNNQLENILNDITYNTKFYKLNINREPTIRALKTREERKRKEEEMKNKKEEQEEKKNEDNNQNSSMIDNDDKDIESDSEDSQSSYDKKEDDVNEIEQIPLETSINMKNSFMNKQGNIY